MQQLGVGLGSDLCWELGNLGHDGEVGNRGHEVTLHVHYPDLSAIYQTYHRTHATPRSRRKYLFFSLVSNQWFLCRSRCWVISFLPESSQFTKHPPSHRARLEQIHIFNLLKVSAKVSLILHCPLSFTNIFHWYFLWNLLIEFCGKGVTLHVSQKRHIKQSRPIFLDLMFL